MLKKLWRIHKSAGNKELIVFRLLDKVTHYHNDWVPESACILWNGHLLELLIIHQDNGGCQKWIIMYVVFNFLFSFVTAIVWDSYLAILGIRKTCVFTSWQQKPSIF